MKAGESIGVHGLSPLARGTLMDAPANLCLSRFIPAGAGNTAFYKKRSLHKAVYPRWRGEHSATMTVTGRSDGLSPLARGTLITHHCNPALIRFIPAGAGNTYAGCTPHSAGAVYPRWRGEHGRGLALNCRARGLSPLARGTPRRTATFLRVIRFIPAGAGNTFKNEVEIKGIPVYPRWRGEHHCRGFAL